MASRTRSFTVRLDPAQHLELQYLAELHERTRGDVVRRLIRDAAQALGASAKLNSDKEGSHASD